uniref:Quinone-interacting membrane-bound oxidoreductase complex subunit C n=1 Tax=uncultured sulfate-reducing bacterium TaxID=153939 RepID=Q3IBM5_9BACT|nr:Quinone-interacting membrane-bound oxidoreductase complex subunit C [uncultured sulfate-reducing bacterium]
MIMGSSRLVEPDLGFIRAIKGAGGETLKKCYQCATCSTTCNLSPDGKPFPRKEMLLASWGQTGELMKDPDVWLCYQCNDCSIHCPRGARPGDVLAAVRSFAYKQYAFPSFMGKALASAKALPLLVLVPILIMSALIILTAPRTADGGFVFMDSSIIDFNTFLPHSTVDALFVLGNIVIFIVAAVGFTRFWRMLQSNGNQRTMPVGQAALLTFKEIFSHSKFRECDANRPRVIGHMLLLFGFIGAMITTGLVLLFIFVPHYLHLLGMENLHSFFELPLDLPHPVKFLGALSGAAITIGGGMLIYRRWTNKDEVGANGYTDTLFLYVMLLTGLTGMTSWLARLTGVPMLAYGNYFVHILCVYFLLWYMPYSKFAHMIYRSLAIVYARSIGRVTE